MRRSLTGQAGPVRRDNLHPMFVALFITTSVNLWKCFAPLPQS